MDIAFLEAHPSLLTYSEGFRDENEAIGIAKEGFWDRNSEHDASLTTCGAHLMMFVILIR